MFSCNIFYMYSKFILFFEYLLIKYESKGYDIIIWIDKLIIGLILLYCKD